MPREQIENLRLRGVQMHIGSQLTTVSPFAQAIRKVCRWLKNSRRNTASNFSIGGGLGIVYQPALASGAAEWWQSAAAKNVLTPARYPRAWCRCSSRSA